MNVSAINDSSAANYIGSLLAYGFNQSPKSKSVAVSAIDPAAKIAPQDILDIDYGKVKEYEAKTNPKYNTIGKENAGNSAENNDLSDEDEQKIDELKARDREVRTHEQAHIAAGGGLVQGGATYTYATGPDGKQYASGGEVNIDMSPEEDPEKTITKMQQVIAAAMAPADPSSQDYSVAATARRTESDARRQLTEEKWNTEGGTPTDNSADTNAKSLTGNGLPNDKFMQNRIKTTYGYDNSSALGIMKNFVA